MGKPSVNITAKRGLMLEITDTALMKEERRRNSSKLTKFKTKVRTTYNQNIERIIYEKEF